MKNIFTEWGGVEPFSQAETQYKKGEGVNSLGELLAALLPFPCPL